MHSANLSGIYEFKNLKIIFMFNIRIEKIITDG